MENGIGIAEDAKLRERNAVETEALERSINKTVDLSLDGSLCSDGEEVFEEAIEAETPCSDSEDITTTKVGIDDLICSLENKKENLDALHENHKFEEVIGAPAVVPSSEDASAKTELLRSEGNRDEKQIASEEIVGDERNGLMEDSGTEDNESAIEDGENHCAAIVDSAAIDDETENFNDGNEILDESNQKPVDEGESHQMEIVDSAAIADETGNLNDENEKLDEPIQEPVDVISEKLSHTGDSVAENNDSAAEDAKIYHVETVDSAIIADETANLNDENEKLDESIQKPVDVMSDKVSHTEDSVAENDDSAIVDGKIHYTEIAGSAAIADETENLHDENEKLDKSIQKPVNVISDKVSHIEDSVAENNDSAIEEEKSHYVEIVDLSAIADETEKSDVSNQKPASVMSNKMSYVEALTSGDAKIADVDNKEALTSEMPETQESNVLEKIDVEAYPRELSGGVTNPEKLDIETYPHEMTETQDCNKVNGGDTESNIPENGSLDPVRLVGSLNHEDKQSADSNALKELIQEDTDVVNASESVPRAVFESNGDVLHKNKHNDILCSGHQQEKHENHSANLSEVLEDKVMELEENSCKDDSHDVDQEENRGIAAAGTSVLDPNLHSTVEDSTPKPEIAKAESHFNSPNLLAEIPRSSQQQLLEASAEVSTNMVESYEHEARKDENVAKVQEPVSHDTPCKTEQEIKPAVDTSSSAISATPAASQNKERGSRPVADTPSSNITSATPTRPAGLGRAAPLLEPTSRVVQQPRVNGAVSATQNQLIEDPTNGETEEYDETREKLQMIRVKFLRLAHRLGQTPHNVVVAQVLYRLGLAEQLHGRSGGRVAAFSFDRASAMAEQLEAAGQEPLDFTCTIMVLGKSGVGKSATINSIFDEVLFGTDAFQMGTKKVQDMVGTVQGIRVRVIDTPGLLPSWSDQRQNEKILQSVKKFIKKTPPDIVLYLDRLDMQSRDMGDMPLLRTITDIFGQSIWFNAIVVLTHAASAPPEGPNGTATSYDMFVTQRSHVVQQAIRQAAGDMRLMNPVSLVENHSACRTNRAGQRVLPNGQVWKPHLLLLSFASKILAEANTLLKLQDTPPGRPFARRPRLPNLPSLLSSLLQSRPEVKLPSEQFGDDDDGVDDDLDECSDSEGESEYDALPPFSSLTKAQLEKLSKVQRNAYYDELEYREKLFMKKQLREERKRRKMMKKMQEAAMDLPADYGDNGEEEASAAASVPVPMPDLALPASFDSDNPTHRYRSLDSSNPWLVRAVLEPNGWDHDIGYDGINVERLFVLNEKVPVSFSGHISKDKKDSSLQMEVASSVKHGKGKATSLGFDMQSVGKDYAYTLRSDTRFSNNRVNKASAGLSATVSGDVLTGGLKLEDKLTIGKRGQLAVSGGAIYGRGEVAYGGTLEATLRDKEHPLGRFLSTLGVSVMDWHGDLAVGCNSQTQIPIGRHTNLIGRFNINNRGSGQFSLKVNSSEQLQIVLIGLIPLVQKVLGYSQQVQYG